MPAPDKFRTKGTQATDTAFYNRVQAPPGTDINQATVSVINYSVKEMLGPQQGTSTGSGSLSVSAVVFNTLQPPTTDSSWTSDNTGYNFKALLPASCFPDAGDYVVAFTFTPSGGGSTYQVTFYHHCNSRS